MTAHKILPLFACLFLLFSVSCKRQKNTKTIIKEVDTTAPVISKKDSSSIEITKKEEKVFVKVDKLDFNYLTIKSKINYKDANIDESAMANFHIKKDSAIWFSVNKIIDIARGVITKDSIHFFAIDKSFKRNYQDLSLQELSDKYGFKLDFRFLQSLLIGEMLFNQRNEDSVSVAGNDVIITQTETPTIIENLISSENHKLKQLTLKPIDKQRSEKATIVYDNFMLVNNAKNSTISFPQTDSIEVLAQKNGNITKTVIDLQHMRIELTDQNPGFVFKKK